MRQHALVQPLPGRSDRLDSLEVPDRPIIVERNDRNLVSSRRHRFSEPSANIFQPTGNHELGSQLG